MEASGAAGTGVMISVDRGSLRSNVFPDDPSAEEGAEESAGHAQQPGGGRQHCDDKRFLRRGHRHDRRRRYCGIRQQQELPYPHEKTGDRGSGEGRTGFCVTSDV